MVTTDVLLSWRDVGHGVKIVRWVGQGGVCAQVRGGSVQDEGIRFGVGVVDLMTVITVEDSEIIGDDNICICRSSQPAHGQIRGHDIFSPGDSVSCLGMGAGREVAELAES